VGFTDAEGRYSFENVSPGTYLLSMRLINFADINKRDLVLKGEPVTDDEVMRLSLSADVVVIGRRTFTNLADVKNPAEDLVGIAASASQGAITSRQLEVRPFMRQGEVLETVPGVIITQHSGEGKANQYFIRGLNLDHGSDFAMTVAGAPVNMVTHAHSQGYADLNFLIPELVAGVQYSKGPYYADLGDFATAGASNINYATQLDRPIAQLQAGSYGFGRLFVAASPKTANGHLLGAFETSTNDGPWTVPDSYRKLNGVIRYSQGDNLNGFSLTGMAYSGKWNASQAVPERAVEAGVVDRYGSIDASDRGDTYRYSLAGEWQRSSGSTLTKVQAFGIAYDLTLLNNFTFYLDDPVHGDQNEQQDHRFITGVKAFQKRQSRWAGHAVENAGRFAHRCFRRRRVAGGDRTALRLVYDETAAKLFGVCLRILHDRSEAEDVLQDVYLNVWRKAASFDEARASPITWLVAIARNRAIDRVRSGAGARLAAPIEDAGEIPDPAPIANETIEAAQENRRLYSCLEELETRQQAAIRAAFVDGLTYEELAERSSVPLGTMKSWIRRGLAKLRACLER
jgi:RNA polymerase sigma factor (sigma-70 family)